MDPEPFKPNHYHYENVRKIHFFNHEKLFYFRKLIRNGNTFFELFLQARMKHDENKKHEIVEWLNEINMCIGSDFWEIKFNSIWMC